MKIDEKLLTQSFINHNNHFMNQMPDVIEAHNFSRQFEKKMNKLITAENKYAGHLWMERFVRYVTRAAVIILCFISINYVTVKAFDFNIWQTIITKTSEFINIHFEREDEENSSSAVRLKIPSIPEGYSEQEFYQTENMTVQHLVSDNGVITYMESLISETADINVALGKETIGVIGRWNVNYISEKERITVFFQDEKFYHILEIEGKDANVEFANKIIEKLEEQ